MRICSLLPSATEIVAGLGLADELVAISHECDHPPNIGTKPVVVRSVIETDRPSREIDAQVRASVAERRGLYRLDDALLRTLDPTLVITQDLCDVCAVTPTEVQRAMAGLTPAPRLLSLNSSRLDDVFEDIGRIGSATHREERATQWVKALKSRVQQICRTVAGAPVRRVACLEWLDPLYSAGHWVPELVALAGGEDLLGKPGEKSSVVSWEQVRATAPEVIVLMPCGLSVERTLLELDRLTSRSGWAALPAVMQEEVYAVDGPAYFNRPGPRLVDGLELLAALFHPRLFPSRPPGARRIGSMAV